MDLDALHLHAALIWQLSGLDQLMIIPRKILKRLNAVEADTGPRRQEALDTVSY